MFQTCESAQTHVHDRLCLRVCEFKALHEDAFRLRDICGAANDPYHLIDMI